MTKNLGASALAAAVAILWNLSAAAQKAQDTLRYPTADPDAGIDTYTMPGSFANVWSPSVYDTLVGFDPAKSQFVGHLAQSFTIVNPTTFDFDIRPNVKWHDGVALSADDVVYTISYLIDPKVTLRYKAYWSWIDKVEKLGPQKVRITAKRAVPDGMMYLAMRTPIFPKHAHEPAANKLDFASRPIGTGPLRITQLDKNRGIIGEKYNGYVASSVKQGSGVGRVVAEPMKDPGTVTAALLTGRADIAVDLPSDQTEDLVKTGRFETTLEPPKAGYIFLSFPAKAWENVKPLSDPRVRLAIMTAIDREALIKLKFGILAKDVKPEPGLCSREQLGCGFSKPVPSFDPAAAKKMLVDAGYADGFDVVISSFAAEQPEATSVAGMLRAIGVRATVRPHPTAQRVQLTNTGKVEIGMYAWSGGGMFDVSGQLGRLVDSNEYGDASLQQMAAPVYTILDDVERRKTATRVFDHITDQAYAFALMPYRLVFTHSKEVSLNTNVFRAEQVSVHEFRWK